ncbi:kinase-like domain-containing protein [Rhizophagus clarus]|uniref:Kinase-like domain-containing protein n=1 Tax=Rhizophagus clarus TaxID=94130 RepID=A0A8H3L9X5_9GLOM|nr:kinase-like domain-containing protein [Rhizophagus clarus]
MEFINAPIGNINLITESHPQVFYKSRLLDFTSKEVNDYIVDDKSSEKFDEIVESECLDYIVDNINTSDIKTDNN